MAVVFTAVASAEIDAVTTITVSLDVGTLPNRAVLVGFAGVTNTTGMSITVGGEACTLIVGTDSGTGGTVFFGKATNLTGLQNVIATWTTAQDAAIGAYSMSGVNQATPFNNGTFTTSVTSPISQIGVPTR